MSRYRGTRLKKKYALWGALPELTSKRPRAGSDLRNRLLSVKKSQYHIRLEVNKNRAFIMGLQNDNDLNTFVSSQKPKGQQAMFYYNYLKCVWITSFFDWVWRQPFLELAN